MYVRSELRIFVNCAVAQLKVGNESLAHGPMRYVPLDACPDTALVRFISGARRSEPFALPTALRAMARLAK